MTLQLPALVRLLWRLLCLIVKEGKINLDEAIAFYLPKNISANIAKEYGLDIESQHLMETL